MTFKKYAEEPWKYNGNSALCLYGIFKNNPVEHNYPHDPDDLCRCIQALRMMFNGEIDNIQHHLELVGNYYDDDIWIRYAENWTDLMDTFRIEWTTKSAPHTYKLMQKIINGK